VPDPPDATIPAELCGIARIERRTLQRAWRHDPTLSGQTIALLPHDEARVKLMDTFVEHKDTGAKRPVNFPAGLREGPGRQIPA
jgi:hypothetical protein